MTEPSTPEPLTVERLTEILSNPVDQEVADEYFNKATSFCRQHGLVQENKVEDKTMVRFTVEGLGVMFALLVLADTLEERSSDERWKALLSHVSDVIGVQYQAAINFDRAGYTLEEVSAVISKAREDDSETETGQV